jgi:NAD(P)-dependent dehydrogenase (short-subunit alcohol dehydrogenase family)
MQHTPVALVTGASRGIGRGIAIELARSGFSVAINFAGNQQAAEECQRLCVQAAASAANARFVTYQADIARREDRSRLLEGVVGGFGWIDLLVNNAGVAPLVRKDILETDEESYDRLMAINAKGPFFLTQAVANLWLSKSQELQTREPKPKIVTVSSVSAYAPGLNRGEYCISKAALSMLTPLFAIRLAEHGINVYEIRPGVVKTDMTSVVTAKYDQMIAEGFTPIARWGTPEDVGRAVAAIAEGQFPFSTGEVFNVDGGFHIRRL